MTENNNIEPEVFHLVYVSSAIKELSINEIRDIERTSQKNNRKAGVTGVLMYKFGRFMQFLEGSETEVKRLISVIERDPRHTNIHVVRQGMIPKRQFSDWHMKYTPLGDIQNHCGNIYKKLFELTTCAKGVLESAEESMSLLLAFKYSGMREPI